MVMINDLHVGGVDLWKYVDDTTIAETLYKNGLSNIQVVVDDLAQRAQTNRFQLNEAKCRELKLVFKVP